MLRGRRNLIILLGWIRHSLPGPVWPDVTPVTSPAGVSFIEYVTFRLLVISVWTNLLIRVGRLSSCCALATLRNVLLKDICLMSGATVLKTVNMLLEMVLQVLQLGWTVMVLGYSWWVWADDTLFLILQVCVLQDVDSIILWAVLFIYIGSLRRLGCPCSLMDMQKVLTLMR